MATMHVPSAHAHSGEQPNFDTPQRIGLGLFGVTLVAAIAGYMASPEQMYRSYLTAFMVAGGLPVAFLAMLMLHHLVGGEWGVILRRPLEAGARSIPYMGLLILPIFFFMMPSLYEWARPDVVAHDKILQDKEAYLNIPFFGARTVLYYLIWGFYAWKLNSMTKEQEAGALGMRRRLNNISGIGLLIVVLCVTFAAFDWSMSTDPHWYSTIFGLITLIGWTLTTMCICAILMCYLRNYAPLNRLLKMSHFHDFGNLMFAMTCLWAYMSFSQFLIIWAANLPEEIPWFVRRMNTSWGAIMALLAVIHFFLPFFLLLIRKNKKAPERLRNVAIVILAARIFEQIWTIEPNFSPGLYFNVLDYLMPLGFLGLFVAIMMRELKARPLAPVEPERIRPEVHH